MELTKHDRDLVARARKRLKSGPYFVVAISSALLVKAVGLGLIADSFFNTRALQVTSPPGYQAMWTVHANGVLHYGTFILLATAFQVIFLSLHRMQLRTDRLLVDLVEEGARTRYGN